VTLVSGLVPTWIHEAADGLFKTPFGKFFFAARDSPPRVTTSSFTPEQLGQLRQAVLQGIREAVQEGREPLVAAIVENTAALHRMVDTLRQDLTYTTTSIVHFAAPTPPSQGNG
jgi:hypothetical protein